MSESPATCPIVGVGGSVGGMEAFGELLRGVPKGTGLAFVFIHHPDATHPRDLSATLARATSFPVLEIQEGMRVEPEHVYLVPSHADVGIRNGTLALFPRSSDEGKPRLPIDFFFKGLAADRGNQAIGVVLSGTGSDGAEGVCAIKAEDGVTFAQAPASAAFGAMPQAAVATGAVDICLPVPEVAREILRIGRHPFVHARGAGPLAGSEDEGELRKVLLLVRDVVGIDFSEYQRAGLRRRLARRMALNHLTRVDEYVRLLRDDRAEVQALSDDILIQVTSFFRDAGAFEKLKQLVFPAVVKRKREGGGAIRIWSVGCSTGEEPYSLAIALLEYLAQEGASDVPIQLFATDVSERAIEKARVGFFPDAAMHDVSAERLARFFTKVRGGGYRISKSVRQLCTFAKHDIATDPPFSGLDLVCCRNVLVYFGQELQKRVLAALQFALDEPGCLLLGGEEDLADGLSLFTPIDRETKIFARTAVKSAFRLGPVRDANPVSPLVAWARAAAAPDLVRRTESLLLHHYAPPSVIVNGRMEILHFQGRTEPYLDPVPGQTQYDLLNVARRGLVADLRLGIALAKKTQAIVRRAGVRVEQDGSTRTCAVIVAPISAPPESPDDVFAVFFEEPPPSAEPGDLAALEGELRTTKDYLRWKIDEHQRTNEELLSVNQELISRNEELQSLNAEVQAGKEEIQSANEELAALNDETRSQNIELDSVNDVLKRALGAAEWARDHAKATVEAVPFPLVVLTEALEIESANRAFQEQYGVGPTAGEEGVVTGLLNQPRLRSALDGVRHRNESFLGLELDCDLPRIGKRCLSLSARFVPMPDAGRLILLAIEDVTARRRVEAERAQLLRETQAAKSSAEEANRTKDIFLATLSHELRTPLSTLLLSAELLRTGQLSEDKVRRTIDSITRATKAQAQLIDDLLDISRIVTGQLKMELRTVDLATCVQAAVDAVTPAAEIKGLVMEVDLSASLAPVPGDPARLQQVVWNLLANAVKFTPEGGRVRLTVDTVDGRGRICVTDSGVGIDAGFVPHLFDRFSQEDRGQTRAHGGLGLGLAIVRHLVDAHGGTVRAESAGKGMGSTFTVSLPLMKASETRRYRDGDGAPAGEASVSIRGARILVVEDDSGTRETLTEMLSLNGADVRSAESAAVAMDIFGAFGPELVVSDIAMPDEDGCSLIGRIRALGRDRGGHVPAVAITALAAAEDRRQALAAGFDRHLAKPVDVDRLLAALSRLLQPAMAAGAADR